MFLKKTEFMKLMQEKGSISSIGKDICPYTKEHCDTIAKIAEESAAKIAKIDKFFIV